MIVPHGGSSGSFTLKVYFQESQLNTVSVILESPATEDPRFQLLFPVSFKAIKTEVSPIHLLINTFRANVASVFHLLL